MVGEECLHDDHMVTTLFGCIVAFMPTIMNSIVLH